MRTRRPVALRQISRHKNAHGFRIAQSRDYGGYEGRLWIRFERPAHL